MANEKTIEKVEQARRETVDTLIKMFDEKGLCWIQEWSNAFGTDGALPRNGTTNRWYAGGNVLHLLARMYANGWKDCRFFTFKQAKERGYFPAKGSHGSCVEYYKRFTGMKDKDGKWTKNKDEAVETFSYIKLAGTFTVFNAEQLFDADGKPMPKDETAKEPIVNLDEHLCTIADRLIETSRCPINEKKGEMEAFYRPIDDSIHVPSRVQFTSMEAFLATLTHEMTHSTGTILERDIINKFGTADYAKEELVAELGSTFTCLELGVHRTSELEADENFKNHAAYLKSWLKSLKNDVDYIFKAASAASRAATYILDRYNGSEENDEESAA